MSFLQELNPPQQEAVKASNGPVMIIAGAGSGKTRVLTYRIAHLISCGVGPGEILALTFTNKAAREMKDRVVKLVGESAARLWMGTFHSMFARMLRKECELIGYTRSFTIYDTEDSLSAIKASMNQLGISSQQIHPQVVRSLISAAKNQLFTPKGYADQARDFVEERAAQIFRGYEKHLERNNAMDFDDLLVKPIQLFTRHPNVLERYQHRFKFILVDEFQDTNRAQYQMTRLLAGKFRNICVVGDDAQSIYAFRGADIRNILDFSNDFKDCQTFRLEQNYRSTKCILEAADTLIRNNVERLKKELWTNNALGDEIRVIECLDDRDEGQTVVQIVHNATAHQKNQLSDIAILYRTNAQSRALEDELRRGGIPYVIVGGIRFYERKEIKDVLAYLKLLVNPRDGESFRRIVNYPARGIGDTTVEKLRSFAEERDLPLFDVLSHLGEINALSDRALRSLTQFRDFILKYDKLRAGMSIAEVVRSLVDDLGILRTFKSEGTPESLGRWENVQELLSAITEFQEEREEGGTLEQFLEEVALVSDIDTWEGTTNAVTLMTLHSSKGLEFPVVVITGLEEGILPFYSNTIDRPNLEEERRLLYVGMTRARSTLYFTRTRMRYRFGEATYPGVSRFLSEIGTDHVIVEESRNAKRVHESVSGRPFRRSGRNVTRKVKEQEFGDPMPDYESESQEFLDIRKGSIVHHETFGKGKVIEVSGTGEAMKAVVQFDDYGMKNLILKFARLRPP